jgi:hypothetical protein
MPNQLRYRYGNVHLRKVRVDAATVIAAGDLVWLDGDDVKPASDFAWDTNLATTQAAFAAAFLGVAHTPSAAGETDDVSVDVGPHSVYQFAVPSGTYEVGDDLGPDEGSSSLQSQQLEAVASAANAIARAAEYKSAASTLLKVTFASAFHTGSSNVNAAIG